MGKKNQERNSKVFSIVCSFLIVFDLLLFFSLVGFWSFMLYEAKNAKVEFVLEGERDITLVGGEKYVEPGYSANYCTDINCLDLTNRVKVATSDEERFDEGKSGEYDVFYSLSYENLLQKWQKNDQRKVKIVDNQPPELVLLGEETIGMYEGEGYSEPGFSAKDDLDGDLTGEVAISGEVDSGTPGVYKVHYSVKDSAGNEVGKDRYVFVYKNWYTFSPTPTKTFDELAKYIQDMGWDISFGYYNLETGKSYTFQGNKLYYGASLVKTLDAMYAYENTEITGEIQGLVRNAITYSNNTAHINLVQRLGFQNLQRYAEEIGMEHHLRGSSIYDETYYFCDTTVEDQMAEWKHLWEIINTNPRGEELKWYFINNYWDNLSFSGSPTHMYKNGLYGNNYHEVGIIFAESPYIVVMLSTEGWRWNSTTIVKDLSHRIFMMNELVSRGEVL